MFACINKYKLISPKQFGFKENSITQDDILNVISKVYGAININGNNDMLCMFLDLAKAFDTLSHNKLLEMLENVDIRGHCLELFKSYLHYRQLIVKIEIRNQAKVTYGVSSAEHNFRSSIIQRIHKRFIFNTKYKS